MPANTHKSLPSGFTSSDNTSDEWRVGVAFRQTDAFGDRCWVMSPERITIKPGETGRQAHERQIGPVDNFTLVLLSPL